jgi:hypothetical protein
MKARDKAIVDQLLARIWDLELALDYAHERLALWETGEVQHDMPDVMDFWGKIRGPKQ